jgi:membrane-associated phospholipid phosphatase
MVSLRPCVALVLLCVFAGAARADDAVAPTPVETPPAPPAPIVEGERVEPVEAAAAAPVEAAPVETAPIETAPVEAAPVDAAPTTVAPVDTPVVSPSPDFFADDQPGHYLAWYGAEYVAVAGLAGLYLAGVHEHIQPAPALIGPRVDLDDMDLAVLMDPRFDATIGKPFLREQVPTSALIGIAAVTILGSAGLDYAATGDLHRTHGVVLGGLEALMGTVLVTEVFKLSFGRLRPDFRDRYLNAACTGVVDTPAGLDCATVDTSRFRISEERLQDGMKSFVSGHSSSAFAMATFSSWWLGSTLVWNKDRPAWGPAVGALSMGTLLAGAGYVASTRLSDHKHHPEDVVVGSLIGATVATTAWFVHFDIDGRARRRSFTVVPTVGLGQTGTGNGLALVGELP